MGDDRNDAPKSNLQIPCPGREGRRSKAIPQNENWPQEDSEKGLRPWSRRSLAQLNGPVAQFQAIFEKITLKGVSLRSSSFLFSFFSVSWTSGAAMTADICQNSGACDFVLQPRDC
jgi:hypothetical protein